jgi:hypothetical protein
LGEAESDLSEIDRESLELIFFEGACFSSVFSFFGNISFSLEVFLSGVACLRVRGIVLLSFPRREFCVFLVYVSLFPAFVLPGWSTEGNVLTADPSLEYVAFERGELEIKHGFPSSGSSLFTC